MELLVAVAEQGSLGSAAAALELTQPTVSARLNRLERQLGLRLVARSPRGSELTAHGAAVADWARSVLAESDRFEAAASALRRQQSGQVSVAASMTVAEYLMPSWLATLQARQPEITVALRVHNSEDVAHDVLAGDADVGFIEGVSMPSGCASRHIGEDRLAVVVPPSHSWARRQRPISVSQLCAARLALREVGSGTRETFDNALARHDAHVQPALELGSTSAIKAAMQTSPELAGVLSVLAVRGDIENGSLREVAVADLDLHRPLRAIWPSGKALGDTAAALVQLATPR